MFWVAFALIVLGVVFIGGVLGIIGFGLALGARRGVRAARRELADLRRRIQEPGGPAVGPAPESAREPEPIPQPAPPAPEPIRPPPAVPPEPAISAAAEKEWLARVEETVGKRWMTWLGGLALFLSAAFFVKYAVDNQWLGPTTRVALGIVFGIALLVLGDRCIRRKMRPLGQGLMGAGLAVLYVSLFAAFAWFDLIGQPTAFAAMVIVTVAGMALAVLHDALSTAFIAVLGGLITPLLLRTGEDPRDVLFAYIVVLDLGVLGVAFFKRWRALDTLAFVGSAALYVGWFEEFYEVRAMVPALIWLSALYVIFLILPVAWHLRRRRPVSLERFIMGLLNAGWAFTCAWWILREDPGKKPLLGFAALGMAACYVVLGSQMRRRIESDARSLFGFAAMAMTFLTIAAPLHLGLNGITLVWAAEIPAFIYLGYRFRYRPVRIGGFVMFLVVLVRLFARHFPLHEVQFTLLWNRSFATALWVPLAGAAGSVVHRWRRAEADATDRALRIATAIIAGFAVMILSHAEFAGWFAMREMSYAALCIAVLPWTLGAAIFLAAGLRGRCLAARTAGVAALAVGIVMAARTFGWDMTDRYIIFLNGRFLAALAPVLVILVYGWALRRFHEVTLDGERGLAVVLYGAGAFLLLVLTSIEAYLYAGVLVEDYSRAKWAGQMAVSVVWAITAMIWLMIGFRRRVRPLRLVALALFGCAALKAVFVDLAAIKQLYRIISFFALGVLMVAAAWAYHRAERILDRSPGNAS